ncbi:hypothetical protein GCM10009733_040570 [Nonomuraea maheshkhaliensis]|uniref:Uncharacterized protein n=1 Tax=Nonomuraea maheshkhaliensis TaxID=419590 RepID=A0ABP4R722_9ACTN
MTTYALPSWTVAPTIAPVSDAGPNVSTRVPEQDRDPPAVVAVASDDVGGVGKTAAEAGAAVVRSTAARAAESVREPRGMAAPPRVVAQFWPRP